MPTTEVRGPKSQKRRFPPTSRLRPDSTSRRLPKRFSDCKCTNQTVTSRYPRISPTLGPQHRSELKNHKATFRRDGNRLEYNLRTTDKLARRIRWSLPVCTDVKLTNHGHPVPVTIEPGIGGLFAVAELPAENESQIVLTYEPVAFEISAPGSVAEGMRYGFRSTEPHYREWRPQWPARNDPWDENSVKTSLKTDLAHAL